MYVFIPSIVHFACQTPTWRALRRYFAAFAQFRCNRPDLPPKTGPGNLFELGRRKGEMAKRRHTPEQMINKLGEAEAATAECGTTQRAAGCLALLSMPPGSWLSEPADELKFR